MKAYVTCAWPDVPHLDPETIEDMFNALPPHQRDARSKGIPSLGSGAVYPVSEESVFIEPFPIPPHFRKTYAMDVGWNNTAAVWLAYDADFDVIYINHEYKAGNVEPAVHASAIRQRGDFTGVVDPASRGRSQTDGEQLFQIYRGLGLKLALADNGVESGIFEVYERLTTGRLKFFNTCVKLREEFRLYRRDERGRIVKENDHLMDCVRYAVVSGLGYAKTSQSSHKTVNSRIPASRSAF